MNIPSEISEAIREVKEERTQQRKPSIYDKSGGLSRAFFCWANPLIGKGFKKKLRVKDLELPLNEEAIKNYKDFTADWNEEKKKPNPSLFRTLRRVFWHQCLLAAIMKLFWGILILLAAFYFVRTLVQFAQDRGNYQNAYRNYTITLSELNLTAETSTIPPPVNPHTEWYGWVQSAFFFLACFLLSMAYQQMTAFSSRAGIRIRGALMVAVFNKAVKIEGIENEVADVTSIVSNDCYQLLEGVTYMHFLWSGPLEAIAIIALLIYLCGLPALVGLGLLIFFLPLQFAIAFQMARSSRKSAVYSEQRIGLLSEVLMAIKLIKFYAWEAPYKELIYGLRRKELKTLWIVFVIASLNLVIVFIIPPLMALGIFATYVSLFGELTSTIAFTTLSLFNTLRMPLVVLPVAVHSVVESSMAMKRIETFLLREEMSKQARGKSPVIKFKNVTVSYQKNPEKPVLKNIFFFVPKGKLLAILGPVGSGKTSIMNAILGEARIMSGKLRVGGTIAYVSQTPWVQQTTIRNNVLFGLPFNKRKYERALFASALQADLPSFVYGDMTEIGEGGINISGGQKQRLAIARAVYADADVYLFDSPLSAVDQHTTGHIFNHCMKDALKGKTIILITHHLDLLEKCDLVCLLEEGAVKYFGKFKLGVFAKEFPGFFDDKVEAKKKKLEDTAQIESDSDEQPSKKDKKKKSKKEKDDSDEHQKKDKRDKPMDGKEDEEEFPVETGTEFADEPPLVDTHNSNDDSDDEQQEPNYSKGDSKESSGDQIVNGSEESEDKEDSKRKSVFPIESQSSFATASNKIDRMVKPVTPKVSLKQDGADESSSSIVEVDEDKGTVVALKKSPRKKDADDDDDAIHSADHSINKDDDVNEDDDEDDEDGGMEFTEPSSSSEELANGPPTNYYNTVVSPYFSVIYDETVNDIENRTRDFKSTENVEDDDIVKLNKRNPYHAWFSRVLYWAWIIACILMAGTQVIRIVSDAWISVWTTGTGPQWYYIAVYAGYCGGFAIGLLFRGLWFFHFTIRAARILHSELLEKVIIAPITFFTVTPIGPLLNSFSTDLTSLDTKMPMALHMGLIYTVILLTSLVLVCIQIPMYTIVAVGLLFAFLLCQWFSSGAIQYAKKISSETNGPIFAHISESLSGVAVIRAFRAIPRFLRKNVTIINKNHAALFNQFHINLWISFYLDFVGVLLVFATALFVVGDNTISAAAGGLAISNTIQVLVFFSWLVREFSTAASEMNAMKRVDSYITQVESENLDKTITLPKKWPTKGKISFQNIVMSYFPNDPPVLSDVSFTIYPGEKIGIVGRTGSGKTTLLMALFRMVEASSGKIIIDGINIKEAGINHMRSRISIIPQDPVLFRGTVRSNLDPIGRYKDKQLWRALKLSGVRSMIPNLDLDMEVEPSGSNFSLGQKQCFCLARAILKNSQILVLDEATSAMDLKTDAFIQQTIRKVFAKQTVITIAHRLDTIIDYNRILVMDKGIRLEFDTPKALLNNPNGAFYKLAAEAGLNALLARVAAAQAALEQAKTTESRDVESRGSRKKPRKSEQQDKEAKGKSNDKKANGDKKKKSKKSE